MKKGIFIVLFVGLVVIMPSTSKAFTKNETIPAPGYFDQKNGKAGLDLLAVLGSYSWPIISPGGYLFVAGLGRQSENFIASPYISRYRLGYPDAAFAKLENFCPYTCYYEGGFHLGRSTNNFEIIVTPNEDAEPLLKIYDANTLRVVDYYYAYPKSMKYGFKATGFIDKLDNEHVAAAPNKGGGPNVRLMNKLNPWVHNDNYDDVAVSAGFMVYSPDYRGGVDIAAGDVDGDGQDELVVSPETDAQAQIKIYELSINGGELTGIASMFYAYPITRAFGANIEVADVNNDGKDEIITTEGKGSAGLVKVYDMNGTELEAYSDYYAYSSNFLGGVTVNFAGYRQGSHNDINRFRLYYGAGPGGGAHIRFMDFPI